MNCPCAEVLPGAKRSYGAKAPPHRVGPRFQLASILLGHSKKEAPALQVLLFWIPGDIKMLRRALYFRRIYQAGLPLLLTSLFVPIFDVLLIFELMVHHIWALYFCSWLKLPKYLSFSAANGVCKVGI